MATNIYMELDKIKGECTDASHKNWLELLSFSHSVTQIIGASNKAGKVHAGSGASLGSFCVTKFIDTSSPDLNIYCAQGEDIAKATVEICQPTGKNEVYWKYQFKNLMVKSISVGTGGGNLPTENICFVYSEVKWTYVPISVEGKTGSKVERTWSLEKNKKI